MTWKDIKTASLQRAFVIEDGPLVTSEYTKPYISMLSYAANEGIYLLAAVGGAGVKSLTFTKTRSDGNYSRFDMNKYAKDFRSFTDEVYIETERGKNRLFGYLTESTSVLVLPSWLEGEIIVYYNPIPQIVTPYTPDDTEIMLLPMACSLLPLYIGSQIIKDDDMRQSVQLRNEFETGLSRLSAMITKDRKKKESFSSVTGWF